MNKLGKLLVLHRTMNNMNQRDLAKEIGVLPSTMCRLENGKSADQFTMVKVINWLFGGSDGRHTNHIGDANEMVSANNCRETAK